MSEQSSPTTAIKWDLADRLRKALRLGDVSSNDMAATLEVSRNSVSAYINGRTQPSAATIRVWALRCGVPYEWLRDGTEPQTSPDPDGITSDLGITGSGCIGDTPGEVVHLDGWRRPIAA